ncbi:hypothetical protein BKA69DRAFT_126622 [Paraphysoderma sedebokerense]|nr:hypothetical protein BKA69DRAFT_126622 [Paraphysoderma sedebokerense]
MMAKYLEKKQSLEQEHQSRLTELRNIANELEEKLEAKKVQRQRHDCEIEAIKKQITEIQTLQNAEIMTLEKKLIEERTRLERESDERFAKMLEQAEQQAWQYLTTHTTNLANENNRLKHELKNSASLTKSYLERKEHLEKRYQELLIDVKIREKISRQSSRKISADESRNDCIDQKQDRKNISKKEAKQADIKRVQADKAEPLTAEQRRKEALKHVCQRIGIEEESRFARDSDSIAQINNKGSEIFSKCQDEDFGDLLSNLRLKYSQDELRAQT